MERPSFNPLRAGIKRAISPIIYSSAALVALSSLPAFAQEEAEEIVVTGSRIRTNGMESPNPVTVVTLDEIRLTSPTTLIEGLAELPQFLGSTTTQNTGNFFTTPGAGTLNLRGLNGKRTLSLLNGRRVVSSTIFGGPDINLFPDNVMSTVESVTGGATAAYGTDAVAGAVNFILNTDYEGFRGNIRGGVTERGDNENINASLGAGFAVGERGHLLLNVETGRQDAIIGRDGYDWYTGTRYMDNPDPNAGNSRDNPALIPYPMVVDRDRSLDGVIFFPTMPDLGTYALNPDGTAGPWVDGDYCDDNQCSIANGGSGTINDQYSVQITPESGRDNLFGYFDYDVTDELNVFVQAIYGEAFFRNKNTPAEFFGGQANALAGGVTPGGSAPTIFSGNPFIPANIQQIMTENNIPYLRLGRVSTPFDTDNAYTEQTTETTSFTVGGKYTFRTDGFLNDWQVDAWYQKGQTDVVAAQYDSLRVDRAYLALDAVLDDNGNVVCNVAQPQYQAFEENQRFADCQPLNLFGRGNASPEAVDYVLGYEAGIPVQAMGYYTDADGNLDPIPYNYTSNTYKGRIIDIQQDAWEISANGVIHEGWGAGNISMALGYAWREESFVQVVEAPGENANVDPNARPTPSNNAARGRRGIPRDWINNFQDLQYSNVPFAKGDFEVDEAFVELRIPALADLPLIEQLNIGLSTRWAEYEGTGEVWSWKGGYDWRINDELRLRGTVSQDVRAPSMGERFDRTGGLAFIFDYAENPNPTFANFYTATQASAGSPDLKPEEAKTFTTGLVYQPNWLDGLQYSMDWYWIKVTDNINQFGAGNVVEGCYVDGDQSLCDLIFREGPESTAEGAPAGLKRISLVYNPYVNQFYTEARGVDFEISYRTQVNWFGGGESLNLRLLGSYLRNQITNNSGEPIDFAGITWPNEQVNISANYTRDRLTVSLQARATGKTIRNRNRNFLGNSEQWDVADNVNHTNVLMDGSVSYRFTMNDVNFNLGFTINNLLDRDPQPNYDLANGVSGDLRGRRYNVSVGFNF